MDEIIVRIIDLPYWVRGQTVLDQSGNYNIYINARLSAEEQQKAYRHELSHIKDQDFNPMKPIESVEPYLNEA